MCAMFMFYGIVFGTLLYGRLAMWLYSWEPWENFVIQPHLDVAGMTFFSVLCIFTVIMVMNHSTQMRGLTLIALCLPYLALVYNGLYFSHWVFTKVFWFIPDAWMPLCVDIYNQGKGAGMHAWIFGLVLAAISLIITIIVRTARDYHTWKASTYRTLFLPLSQQKS